MGNEIRIGAEILRTSVAIKQRLGLLEIATTQEEVVPHHLLYDTRSYYGEEVARLLGDPSKRNRVMSAVKAMMERTRAEASEVVEESTKQPVKAGGS